MAPGLRRLTYTPPTTDPGPSCDPADGVVQDRTTDVNESMITGESRPVRKEHRRDCRNREWIRITAGSMRAF